MIARTYSPKVHEAATHALLNGDKPRSQWHTACGLNASEWNVLEPCEPPEFIESAWSCSRCVAKLNKAGV